MILEDKIINFVIFYIKLLTYLKFELSSQHQKPEVGLDDISTPQLHVDHQYHPEKKHKKIL